MKLIDDAAFKLKSFFHNLARPSDSITVHMPAVHAFESRDDYPAMYKQAVSIQSSSDYLRTRVTSENDITFTKVPELKPLAERLFNNARFRAYADADDAPALTVLQTKEGVRLVFETPEQIDRKMGQVRRELKAHERKRPVRAPSGPQNSAA